MKFIEKFFLVSLSLILSLASVAHANDTLRFIKPKFEAASAPITMQDVNMLGSSKGFPEAFTCYIGLGQGTSFVNQYQAENGFVRRLPIWGISFEFEQVDNGGPLVPSRQILNAKIDYYVISNPYAYLGIDSYFREMRLIGGKLKAQNVQQNCRYESLELRKDSAGIFYFKTQNSWRYDCAVNSDVARSAANTNFVLYGYCKR